MDPEIETEMEIVKSLMAENYPHLSKRKQKCVYILLRRLKFLETKPETHKHDIHEIESLKFALWYIKNIKPEGERVT